MFKNLINSFLRCNYCNRNLQKGYIIVNKQGLFERCYSNSVFNGKLSRFNDVHVSQNNIKEFIESNKLNQSNSLDDLLEEALKNSLNKWKAEGKSSIWLYVPIELSNLITIASKYGFQYHHAEENLAVIYKWLLNTKSTIPRYATHQIGVSGFVYREDSDEVLVIKDKNAIKSIWKLPGGAADLSENIEDTACREVFEETGIKSKFQSIIAFRQQHNYPGAFGRSDIYFVCRLKPESYDINACNKEIAVCEWHKLDRLCLYNENPLLKRVAKLVDYAKNNFDLIDFNLHTMKSVIVDTTYGFYHKKIPNI